jgi:homoserine dehydrogenase
MATFVRSIEDARLRQVPVCKIALAGFGTVGSAVARLLYARSSEHNLQLTRIFNRGVERKKTDWVSDDVLWTDDIEELLSSDADVLVELIGGVNPAYDWVKRALQAGKSVVTANKQLMAHHGAELLDLARERGQQLAFGASVAGGIPVLTGLHEGLAGDRLQKVTGILNGTCNFILTKIERTGSSFADALAEAQKAGFAEADSTDDVDGFDARAKLVILARFGLNAEARPDQVAAFSIRKIDGIDFEYAHELNCTIRQISRAEVRDGHLYASVEPALVPRDSPLASVSGSQNLVISTGEFGGDTVFSGYGAGGNPTAVAVVSDLLHLVRYRAKGSAEPDRPVATAYPVSGDFETPYSARFVVRDTPGIIAAIAGAFANHHINIDAVFQKSGFPKEALPFVITLEPCRFSKLDAALKEIAEFKFHVQPPFAMPVLR